MAPELVTGWVDTTGLAIVAVLTFLGVLRGLWWQIARLAGLVGAVLLARSLAPRAGARVAGWLTDLDPRVVHGLAWVGVFLAALLVAAWIGRMGRSVLEAMQLGLVDRVGGALAGTATGALVWGTLLGAAALLAPPQWTRQHLEGTWSAGLLDAFGSRWSVAFAGETRESVRSVLLLDRTQPEATGPGAAAPPPEAPDGRPADAQNPAPLPEPEG